MKQQLWYQLCWIPIIYCLISFTASANEGQFLGAKETVYPDWFKESFLDLTEDVAAATEVQKRLLLLFHHNN